MTATAERARAFAPSLMANLLSVERDPLAFPHPRAANDPGHPTWCSHPERKAGPFYANPVSCPGCRVALMALALDHPAMPSRLPDGRQLRIVDRLREIIDSDDPHRVLFERALAMRGIA